MQPIIKDANGILRFKSNKLVEYLCKRSGLGIMNELATVFSSPEHNEDHEQLAQLIGYPLSRYSELSYVSDKSYELALAKSKQTDRPEAELRAENAEKLLQSLRDSLREPIAALFGVHPDDLKGRGM